MLTAWAAAGMLLIVFVLAEAFEALVLPRRVVRPFRFTRLFYRFGWRAWTTAALLFPAGRRRQTFLSLFGPLSLLVLFGVWAAALVVGFGFVHHAFGIPDASFADALYLSGTTFTTLGYGDVNPRTPAGRVVSVVEGATGFGFFAVVVSYLPYCTRRSASARRSSPGSTPGPGHPLPPAVCSSAPRPGRTAGRACGFPDRGRALGGGAGRAPVVPGPGVLPEPARQPVVAGDARVLYGFLFTTAHGGRGRRPG